MKKLILFLLILVMAIMGISFATGLAAAPEIDEGAVIQQMDAAPSFHSNITGANYSRKDMSFEIPDPIPTPEDKTEPVEEAIIEQSCFRDDIPLTYEEQSWLQAACEEFEVPYALALGLIEKESNFQNIAGDQGASTGYMQIQQKWHWNRMERLGVTNLLNPNGNFRVGCDFLSELYEKYNDWSIALTVYNMGHNPGCVTDYAKTVMNNYAHWQELIEAGN